MSARIIRKVGLTLIINEKTTVKGWPTVHENTLRVKLQLREKLAMRKSLHANHAKIL